MEVYEYPGYRCGPCPPGLQGNGTHCDDINEVGEGRAHMGADNGDEGKRGSSRSWGILVGCRQIWQPSKK